MHFVVVFMIWWGYHFAVSALAEGIFKHPEVVRMAPGRWMTCAPGILLWGGVGKAAVQKGAKGLDTNRRA